MTHVTPPLDPPLVRAAIDVPRFRQPRRTVRSRCLRRISVIDFNYDLVCADWSQVYDAPSVALKWDSFTGIFLPIVDSHAPLRTMRIRNAHAPVITDETRAVLSRRRAALASFGHGSTEYKQLSPVHTAEVVRQRSVERNVSVRGTKARAAKTAKTTRRWAAPPARSPRVGRSRSEPAKADVFTADRSGRLTLR